MSILIYLINKENFEPLLIRKFIINKVIKVVCFCFVIAVQAKKSNSPCLVIMYSVCDFNITLYRNRALCSK